MKLVDGKLVLGVRPCWRCNGTRKMNEWADCPRCGGTGEVVDRRYRGGKHKPCVGCLGPRTFNEPGRVIKRGVPCTSCADGTQPENWGDNVPPEVYRNMEFRVFRNGTYPPLTHPVTPVYSCTDYGDWKQRSDAELIERAKSSEWGVQASKLADKEGNLYAWVGVFCVGGGYCVVAVRGDEDWLRTRMDETKGE